MSGLPQFGSPQPGDLPEDDAGCKPGCLLGDGHDGECLDDEDVAELKLQSKDYEGWARL